MSPLFVLAGLFGVGLLLLSSGDDKAKDKGDRKVGPGVLPPEAARYGGPLPYHVATVSYVDRARPKTRYPVTWGDRIETWRARDAAANGESSFEIGPETMSAVSVQDPAREGAYPVPGAWDLRGYVLAQQANNPTAARDRMLVVDQFGALVGELTRSSAGIWSVTIPLSNGKTFSRALNTEPLE